MSSGRQATKSGSSPRPSRLSPTTLGAHHHGSRHPDGHSNARQHRYILDDSTRSESLWLRAQGMIPRRDKQARGGRSERTLSIARASALNGTQTHHFIGRTGILLTFMVYLNSGYEGERLSGPSGLRALSFCEIRDHFRAGIS
jgi:hypothetical protein